jgi:hypothetical protein
MSPSSRGGFKVTIKEAEPVPPPKVVIVEMTLEEAQALRSIHGALSTGTETTALQKASGYFFNALYNADIEPLVKHSASVFENGITPRLK